MTESSSKSETMVVKMYFEKPPEFTVTYKDKEDLYQSFKNQLDKWNTSKQATHWIDPYGELVKIDNADVLYRIVTNGNETVSVLVSDEVADSEPEYKEAIEKRKKKKEHKIHCGGDRYSRGHSRSHSRDSSDHEDFQECYGLYRPYYGPPHYRSPHYGLPHDGPPYYGPPQFLCPSHGRPPIMSCPCIPFHFPKNNQFGGNPFFGMGHGCCRHQNNGMRRNFHGY